MLFIDHGYEVIIAATVTLHDVLYPRTLQLHNAKTLNYLVGKVPLVGTCQYGRGTYHLSLGV